MFKKYTAVMVFLGTLVGCNLMLPHYNFSDTQVTGVAKEVALVLVCVEKGLLPATSGYAFGYAVSNLYSVAVYNEDLYKGTYQMEVSKLRDGSYFAYNDRCKDIAPQLIQTTELLTQRYRIMVQERQLAIADMSQQLNTGVHTPDYSKSLVKLPNNQVSFNNQQPKPNHYLVDFKEGQLLCTATDSGFVTCN
jgi:hypothetical protein